MNKYLVALGVSSLLVLSACGDDEDVNGSEEVDAEENGEEVASDSENGESDDGDSDDEDEGDGGSEDADEEENDEGAEIVIGEPMELDDYTLTVQDYRLGVDHDGNDALVIEYDWVNDSDENAAPHMTFSFTAYQDGVETDRAGVVEDVDLSTGQSDAQPGGEIEGAEAVVGINDMEEEFELELDVLISFSGEPYTTTIDLEDLE